jgi:hypothetical protein
MSSFNDAYAAERCWQSNRVCTHPTGDSMADELERGSPEWLEEWERLQPLLEEWKTENNPLLSESITASLKRLGLLVPPRPRKNMMPPSGL